MSRNKRGLSEVIASVLTIMLVIVAVGVIYAFVVPFVKNTLQKSTECTSYKEVYLFDDSFGWNCYDENLYALSIKSNAENFSDVGGLKLVLVEESGITKVLEIKEDSLSSRNENGLWMGGGNGNLEMPKRGGTKTYGFNASASTKYVSAEVYPFLKSGRICADTKETIKFKACSRQVPTI